jgi:hypothetical protein
MLPGPAKQVVQSICFNFTHQLHLLVSDRTLFPKLDNLDDNADNPSHKCVPPNVSLSTTNLGQWYNMAHRHKVKNPAKDFIIPIIMACDETHLQKGGKASSWPFLFTTSIFCQKMGNLSIAWHNTLGYINDLFLIQSNVEDKNHSKELKAKRPHSIFKAILATLIEAQQARAFDHIPLLFGDETKRVKLKVSVLFIIGDMQGGDQICCTTCHYSNKLDQLCRECNVRGDLSGDPLPGSVQED